MIKHSHITIVTRLCFATFLSFLSFVQLNAQKYTSKLLTDMAENLKLSLVEVTTPGYYDCGSYKGKDINYGVNAQGCVEHIGYKLFPQELKLQKPSSIYDFVERYFLEMIMSNDLDYQYNKLKTDNVLFETGTLQDYMKLSPKNSFSLNKVEDRYYQLIWSDNDHEIINMYFPIQYELLLGMPKIEVEKSLEADINSSKKSDTNAQPLYIPETEMIEGGLYRSIPVIFYENKSLTSTKYYTKKDDVLELVFSEHYKLFSAANLFLTDIGQNGNYSIRVQQNLYGGVKSNFTVSLKQWLQYCREKCLALYFAIEDAGEDIIKALVIARNADLGYNHMMSIEIPSNFVQSTDVEIKAKLNAYIPTQNVKELYGKYTPSRKKKIIE